MALLSPLWFGNGDANGVRADDDLLQTVCLSAIISAQLPLVANSNEASVEQLGLTHGGISPEVELLGWPHLC